MNQRLTEYNLNSNELEQLIDKYVTTIVDSMSTKDLYEYVANDMTDFCNSLSFSGVLEEVKYTLDEEMLEEFVTEIKNDSKD